MPPTPSSPENWRDRKLDPFGEEWKLFRANPGDRGWVVRFEAWEKHFAVYKRIRGEADGDPEGGRIDSLFQHLNVLDAKFGILLSFTSFLLIGFNVLLSQIRWLIEPWHGNSLEPFFFWSIVTLSTLFGAFGLEVIWLCLAGVRRIIWGDLGKDIADPVSATPDAIKGAHEQHLRDLIVELARRTNRFRVAMLFTRFQFFCLCLVLIFGAALVLLPRFIPLTPMLVRSRPPGRLLAPVHATVGVVRMHHYTCMCALRNRPVYDALHAAISSGVPVTTTSPPACPPSGPKSITWSAVLITSR